MVTMEIFDPMVAYGSIDDINTMSLIKMVRNGIGFATFDKFANKSPFSQNEWSICIFRNVQCRDTVVRNALSTLYNLKK